MELLRKVRNSNPEVPVVIVTAFGSIQNAVEAMRDGAYDYITKPIAFDELAVVVQRALEHYRLRAASPSAAG